MARNSPAAVWSMGENKIFETSLVRLPDCAEKWDLIAQQIPGKSAEDVRVHYEHLWMDVARIESGEVEPPNYPDEYVSYGWDGLLASDLDRSSHYGVQQTQRSTRLQEVERKRGKPWTKEEHSLFLIGLKQYGKGDWRSISRDIVVTKSPTQVASHAQKYYLRRSLGDKEKKRSSIHDIVLPSDLSMESMHDTALPSDLSMESVNDTALPSDLSIVPAQPNGEAPNGTYIRYFYSEHL